MPGVVGLVILDSSWVSDQTGWVLGSATCAGGGCTVILQTKDGGQTWRSVASPPPTPVANETCSPCLSHLRFANTRIGYASGDSGLFMTTDGARSWQKQTAPMLIEDLEISGGTAIRVVADGSGCPGPCHPRLESSVVGTATWHQLTAPAVSEGFGESLVVEGSRIYYVAFGHVAGGAGNAQSRIARSVDAGATWQTLGDPCGPSPSPGGGSEVDTRMLSAAGGGFLAALCVPRAAETATAFVLTSSNAGATFGPELPIGVPQGAIPFGLSAGSPSNLAVAGVQGSSHVVSVSHDGGSSWRPTLMEPLSGQGVEVGFLGFEDAVTARASFAGSGTLWTTTDAGESWHASKPAP